MTHARRLNPVVVGASSTVGPYFCTKDCSTKSSLSGRSSAAASSSRMECEWRHPTWLHSSSTWLQLHTHINLWPNVPKRASWSPAPRNANTARVRSVSWRGRTGRLARHLPSPTLGGLKLSLSPLNISLPLPQVLPGFAPEPPPAPPRRLGSERSLCRQS